VVLNMTPHICNARTDLNTKVLMLCKLISILSLIYKGIGIHKNISSLNHFRILSTDSLDTIHFHIWNSLQLFLYHVFSLINNHDFAIMIIKTKQIYNKTSQLFLTNPSNETKVVWMFIKGVDQISFIQFFILGFIYKSKMPSLSIF